MKTKKTPGFAAAAMVAVIALAASANCQEPIHARTDVGKEVILNPDGTWKYVATAAPSGKATRELSKPADAKKLFKPERGSFGIWYDETKWQLMPKAEEPGRTEFAFKRGDGYAIAIVEELAMPLASLRKVALANAKAKSPDARIVMEESRVINGKEVLCLRIDATIEDIPFKFYGYYYTGKQGMIQLLTFTGDSLFEKYESDFLGLLNGLEIY